MFDKDALEKIVDKGHVQDGPDILEEYSSDLSFVPRVRPRGLVRPGNSGEVQAPLIYKGITPRTP